MWWPVKANARSPFVHSANKYTVYPCAFLRLNNFLAGIVCKI